MRRTTTGREDGGQMLLLSGIILVLSFVAMAFTLSQVADVEKEAANEQDVSFLGEWRFVQEKLGGVLRDGVGPSTDADSFVITFDAAVENHRNTLTAKGYDARVTLAGAAGGLGTTECSYLDGGCPGVQDVSEFADVDARGGFVPLNHTYDGEDDGVILLCETPHPFIAAAVVHITLSDGTTSVAETVVFAVNAQDYKERVAMNPADRC